MLGYVPPASAEDYGDLYVLDRYRAQVEYGGLDAAYNDLRTRWRTDYDVMEEAANGVALTQAYANKPKHDLRVVSPHQHGGKITRANHTLRRLGRVDKLGRRVGVSLYLPSPDVCPWVHEVKAEHAHFPMGTYADQVDALSQGVIYVDVIEPGDGGPPADMSWVAGAMAAIQGRGGQGALDRAIRRLGA